MTEESENGVRAHQRVHFNQSSLSKSWKAEQRSTKDDWVDWMRGMSVELIKHSPSLALRACCVLAQAYNPLARELFNAAFVSCWVVLHDHIKDDLVVNLELAFKAPNIPTEILQMLLNLAEFMQHDDKALPIDIKVLGKLAEKVHAFAKALHYKEIEFRTSPSSTIEALISINNQLQQPEAAEGVLAFADNHISMQLKESWHEKLQRWEDALEAYERKQLEKPNDIDLQLGRMRCLRALGQWHRLAHLASRLWQSNGEAVRQRVAPLAAEAAWHHGQWEDMQEYVNLMEPGRSQREFFRSILAFVRNDEPAARGFIDASRRLLDGELTALVGESYNRAYHSIVHAQQISELEEVIAYRKCTDADERARIRAMWQDRLSGCQGNVDVWQSLLMVRSLVLSPHEDLHTWIRFSSLCRRSGRLALSLKVLTRLFDNVNLLEIGNEQLPLQYPQVNFAYSKHLWASGLREEAFGRLQDLVAGMHSSNLPLLETTSGLANDALMRLKARALLKTGAWHLELCGQQLDSDTIAAVSNAFYAATRCDPNSYRVWHEWAVMNFRAIDHYSKLIENDRVDAVEEVTGGDSAADTSAVTGANSSGSDIGGDAHMTGSSKSNLRHASPNAGKRANGSLHTMLLARQKRIRESHNKLSMHLVPAIKGFFRSVALSSGGFALQDILRLLTLWFAHGMRKDVEAALVNGFNTVSIDTWLAVIPQIIARVHTSHLPIRRLIHELLCKVGQAHPQALVYPLAVAAKSNTRSRQMAAVSVLNNMRQHSPILVEQSILVSRELIRVAILWHEMWHEALEKASHLWFGKHDAVGMLEALEPLHRMLDAGPVTMREVVFIQSFGRDLEEAEEWSLKFQCSGRESDLNQAWDLYASVFRRVNKELTKVSKLELRYVSPALLHARDMQLAVPGTYRAGRPVLHIGRFEPTLRVIESKQRPRKLKIRGSDGAEYGFLLKGHEDLRLDERVMQMFSLVNTLLVNDGDTAKQDLRIRGYSVIPLSPTSGIIQWLENCDTLHALIKEYRDLRQVLLNIEHRMMLQMSPHFQKLSSIQKIEVFEHALNSTTGQDLYHMLWLKSRDSEMWLDRRTNYTRSLAVMSMVGYILGLGDRHPCNVMIDRFSGKVIHIDFGDCFEVAMTRDKFPETVPFRLTRMLVNAMEVSGIEGNYRSTCESVMRVLRENRESVMAVLEAFVYDPLINWRLLQNNQATSLHGEPNEEGKVQQMRMDSNLAMGAITDAGPGVDDDGRYDDEKRHEDHASSFSPSELKSQPIRRKQEQQQLQQQQLQQESNREVRNQEALSVLDRVSSKLRGKDFGNAEAYEVPQQVRLLIQEATSIENLCQCYIGWCSFW